MKICFKNENSKLFWAEAKARQKIFICDNYFYKTDLFMIPGNYLFPRKYISQYLGHEVYYLHPTDEREASEEPHGSSYGGHLVGELRRSILQWWKQILNFP